MKNVLLKNYVHMTYGFFTCWFHSLALVRLIYCDACIHQYILVLAANACDTLVAFSEKA